MSDTQITIPKAMTGIEQIAASVRILGEESPEKAYIIGHQFAKIGKELQDEHKDRFQSYFDSNKELPGGFDCQIRGGRTTYEFEANAEWKAKKAELDAIEAKLKNATEQSIKGNTVVDENGEIIDPVPFKKAADSYALTKKK